MCQRQSRDAATGGATPCSDWRVIPAVVDKWDAGRAASHGAPRASAYWGAVPSNPGSGNDQSGPAGIRNFTRTITQSAPSGVACLLWRSTRVNSQVIAASAVPKTRARPIQLSPKVFPDSLHYA